MSLSTSSGGALLHSATSCSPRALACQDGNDTCQSAQRPPWAVFYSFHLEGSWKTPFPVQTTTLPQTFGSNPTHEWSKHLGCGCGAGTPGVQDLPAAVQSIRIVLIPLTQPPSGPAAGPARASPRDGWPWELISCCVRQMNCFGRKYQRSLHVVRHKGCWILKSCFQHPLQGCCFRAATVFGMSPVLQSTVGVFLSPYFWEHQHWKWV